MAAPSSVLRHAGSCNRIKKRLILRVFTVKEVHTAPPPLTLAPRETFSLRAEVTRADTALQIILDLCIPPQKN